MKTKLSLLLVSFFFVVVSPASVITVPGSFNTIQEAIIASSSGDTVIVTPGTYFENINFYGKNIVVTSLFYLTGDISYITSTIINGSNPLNPDTGSCVIFNSFEDSAAILQGFTITGGTGTVWFDIHGAGTFREGGGILIENSSPTIRHNFITGNVVTDMSGVISTGGGGIRVGDGNPEIINNVITHNEARYGAGIVLNYTGCVIRNNIISSNTGGQDYFGGSGIWINNNMPASPKIIENNTIVNNFATASNGTGGVSVWIASNVQMKNNIIYGNLPALQIKTISSAPQVDYSNIQGGFAGTGNIDVGPMFALDRYFLLPGSPCMDGGDLSAAYNDKEDLINPGNALWPSIGSVRNDMGAFGGPGAFTVPQIPTSVSVNEINLNQTIQLYPNPASEYTTLVSEAEFQNAMISIYDNVGRSVFLKEHVFGKTVDLNTSLLSAGMYMIVIQQERNQLYTGQLLISP